MLFLIKSIELDLIIRGLIRYAIIVHKRFSKRIRFYKGLPPQHKRTEYILSTFVDIITL